MLAAPGPGFPGSYRGLTGRGRWWCSQRNRAAPQERTDRSGSGGFCRCRKKSCWSTVVAVGGRIRRNRIVRRRDRIVRRRFYLRDWRLQGVAIGDRAVVEHWHRNVRTRQRRQPASDADNLLVFGRARVDLFDLQFFALILSGNPSRGEVRKVLASLKI